MVQILKKISLFLAAVLVSTLTLPYFGGDSDKTLLLILSCGFIGVTFITFTFERIKANNWKDFFSNKNFSQLDYAVLALLGAVFIATISSHFFKESINGLFKYALYGFIYLAFAINIKDRNSLNTLLGAATIGFGWTLVESFKQVTGGAEALATWEDPNIHMSEQLNRIYSTFGNPNLYGAYLLLSWPLVAAALQRLPLGGFRLYDKQISYSYIPAFLVAIGSMYLILQTGSRSAWLGLMVQLGLICLFIVIISRSTILRWLTIGLSSLVGIYLICKPNFWTRLLSIFNSYDHSSNSFRLHVWKACFKMFLDNPVFGVGPGSKSFYQAYGLYMDSKYSALGAYSLPIEIAVEAGIVGITAFLYFVFLLFKILMKLAVNLFKSNGNQDLLLVFCGITSLSGLFVSSMFDIVILRPQIQILFWLLISIIRYLDFQVLKNGQNS
jgi:putative inorganic carbon (HCO3(-)) transporter